MENNYFPPKFKKAQFHCPLCHVYAAQVWDPALSKVSNGPVPGLMISACTHCNQYSVWRSGEMVYPDKTGVQPPNEDLPEGIVDDYNEAASILNKSPRGAAALLRLAIQKLCVVLGEKGKKIDDDIASLVKKGLPPQIQQALDIVRVIGNEAVHPGTIDLRDDSQTAGELFVLVNLIAETQISTPKRVAEMYSSLPQAKLDAIKNRDKST